MEVLSKMKLLLKKDKATQTNNQRPEVGKKVADKSQSSNADKKHSTIQTVPAVLQSSAVAQDISFTSTQLPASRISQQSKPQNLSPDILSSEILLEVAKQIVNRSGKNASLPGTDFITQGEAFLVKASAASQFFRNCRDVFFSSKNRDGQDSFSKNVFKKAEEQFKQIKSQHIVLGKNIEDAVIKPMNAGTKEQMTRLLMQMRWASSIAFSPKERYRMYDQHTSYYHSLKGCWGVSYDESKELLIELEGLWAEISQNTNAIDETILTPEYMRNAKFRKCAKLYNKLTDDANKRILINEVFRLIEQFKIDAIIDAIAKKIQQQKVIYKDEPFARADNNSKNNKYKIEFDIDMIVLRLEQLKKETARTQLTTESIKQKQAEFNLLIDEAIKRLMVLKSDPTGQVYTPSTIMPDEPALGKVLEDVINKLSHLRSQFICPALKQETAVLHDFHPRLNEYQQEWQTRLHELKEKNAVHVSRLQPVV